MRKLLNVLYVTNPDAYLTKDGENLVVRVGEGEVFRVPIHLLEGVVVFGHLGASPALLGMCLERGVTISLLTPYGKHLATVQGLPQGNVLLRRKQYRWADSESLSLKLAKAFIIGKAVNSRTVLRRFISDYGSKVDTTPIESVNKIIARNVPKLLQASTLDEVRGIEGETARLYFSVFDQLIVSQKAEFFMRGRNRRPPWTMSMRYCPSSTRYSCTKLKPRYNR